MKYKLVLAAGMAAGAAFAAPTEMEVRSLEQSAREAQVKLANLQKENRLLAEREKALCFTADLISGRRNAPPKRQIVEKEVLRFCEEPVTLDNRTTGKKMVYQKWLQPLKCGVRYRVHAKLEIKEIRGTGNFKFGMMVPRPGQEPDWPTADVGGQPLAERDVAFDYFLPEGGSNLFLIGFETGKGLAVFHDVRFCELTEELK